MDKKWTVLDLLPNRFKEKSAERIRDAEEIRLRAGRRPAVLINGDETPFSEDKVSELDLLRILEKATGASLHSVHDSLSDGYVNYRGIRIGVCGIACVKNEQTSVFQRVSSLAIRIPRECKGICSQQIDCLIREGFRNTLVLGPPGAGKTTALREMIRRLADSGYRVGVVDEKNELAAWDGEGHAYDLGRCADVLCGLPKGKAAMMLLRGMNPGIIAMDEITKEADLEVLGQISGCGVGILASVHAADREDLLVRDAYRNMLERHLFSSLLVVRQTKLGRQYSLERCDL